jgi:acetyl esterase/lipase
MAVLSGPNQHAWMSQIHPEFRELVPTLDEAFRKIWTFDSIEEFRDHWTVVRSNYSAYIPTQGFEIDHQMIPLPDGVAIEIRIYRPMLNTKGPLPLLFVMHGGGWVVGNHDTEGSMSRAVCVRNQMAVISVDYRRAPEHKFPTAIEDGYHAFKWIISNSESLGIDSSRVILAGSSAGGNLIAGLALKLRDENSLGGVLGQVLNIPAVCHPDYLPRDTMELESYEQNADAPTTNGQHMRWFWKHYCPELGDNPLASPLLAMDHSNLPAALIQVAGLDALRDEGIAYSKVLARAGVPVKLKTYPGLPHGFVVAVKLDAVTVYFQSIVDWIAERLESSKLGMQGS